MRNLNVSKLLTASFAVALIGLAALPLSSLLVATSQPPIEAADTTVKVELSEETAADAVATLMAGNVVGRSRGCSFGLRRPASAFVP